MCRVAILTAIIVTLSSPAFAQDNVMVQRLADQLAEAFNNNAAAGVWPTNGGELLDYSPSPCADFN